VEEGGGDPNWGLFVDCIWVLLLELCCSLQFDKCVTSGVKEVEMGVEIEGM
jgi:hypothetical protein